VNPVTIIFKSFTTSKKPIDYSSGNSSNFSYKPGAIWKRQKTVARVTSNDYYSEINVATLKHLYTSNLD
jgi:hypothetical protein